MNISKINLNLLVVLHSLLETLNVTRTSEKLFVTQSTISNSLTQLRDIFKDELFIRAPRGLIPTAKALSIQSDIADIMEKINSTVYQTHQFEPKTSDKTFTLAMSDYCEYVILPNLMARLNTIAPNIKIIVKAIGLLDEIEHFAANEVDIALGVFNQAPNRYKYESILKDKAAVIACKKHPLIKKKQISIKDYLKEKHMVVYYNQDPYSNLTDVYIRSQKKERDVQLWMPHLLAASHTLIKSSLLLTCSKNFAKKISRSLPLSFRELPFLTMSADILQCWHLQQDKDPANSWLREQVKASLEN
jgi:DNA-binding transcriptional LysR family regulator